MTFYSFEIIPVGIILLSGMALGGVKIWLTHRNYNLEQLNLKEGSE
jgi:hypothetical protein